MIATVLLITKKLIDLLKEYLLKTENYDSWTIDLFDDSLYSNNSITESMIIFSNCSHVNLSAFNNLNCDNNNNPMLKKLSWSKRKPQLDRREDRQNFVLNAHKKMECGAESSKVSLGGTGMSPRKTPISPRGIVTSPESDCNSNNLNLTNKISTIMEKPQDLHDLFQDNSEYQWIMDFGYKDNTHYQSVFSVLHSQDLPYYDDLARDLDANLAEVDMDDFHRGDIHSVLSTLSNMCNSDIQGVEEREMFASVSESMMMRFGLDCCSPHSSSQQEENSNSVSLCKSELLFSPVRESLVPNGNLSVDSLDLSDNDINLLITCQANKNNYTIAFEGSTVMGSDDSVCHDIDGNCDSTFEEVRAPNCTTHCQARKHGFNSNIDSMARSDSVYTTWSKIKQHSSEHLQLKHQPTGNNKPLLETSSCENVDNSANAVKSLSLPNIFRQRRKQNLRMSASSKFNCDLNSPMENEHCVKLYDIQKSNSSESCDHSTSSAVENTQGRPHNLNLVKLFIKQKSASHEGMCNYVRDEALYSSYSEGNKQVSHKSADNFLKKDCVCHLSSNQIRDVRLLKNNWTENNRKNVHECSLSGFEDSLVFRNTHKNGRLEEKENLASESVEEITESSKQISESVEQITESCNTSEHIFSNAAEESSQKIYQRADVKSGRASNVNNNNSMFDNHKSKYYSDESAQENGSNTESAENIMCHCRKSQPFQKKINVMEKSIQTSKLLDTNKTATVKEVKVPAYILYPNYSLPNLEFLKEKYYVQNIDFTKIFLRPQTFKEPEPKNQTLKRRAKTTGKRPFSVNDIETLKRTGFGHVRDWDSLTFLLPREYKEFLQEIPEITAQLTDVKNVKEDLKPLFSLNAPSRKMKKRPISCDSNFFTTDCRSSNFSSTATQPSSGYRGSSTMLNSNNSTATPSPRNPSSGFKYDSIDSVYNSRKNTTSRSRSLLNSEGNDEPPSRPPLPKSILRNHSLDSTKYTCKTQKDNANKRYSMIEFSENNHEICDNKLSRRRSAQDPYCLKSPQKSSKTPELKPICDSDERSKNNCCFDKRDKNYEDEMCVSFKSSSLENDMRRLEELLEISAVFGESMESFTEHDMLKLRSQVSRFLTMQKNLQKVSDCLQTVNEKQISCPNEAEDDEICTEKRLADLKHSHTPNNTPEHKKKQNLPLEDYENKMYLSSCRKCCGEDCQNPNHWQAHQKNGINFKEDGMRGLKKTVSFAEKISSLMKNKEPINKDLTPPNSPTATSLQAPQKAYQGKLLKLVDVPISEESSEGSPSDSPQKNVESNSFLIHKKDLVLDVKSAVDKIIHQSNWNNDRTQEELSNLCLHHLCPSLYAVLSDGLKEEIDTAFGPIRNSVWSVIEASSQQGPLTETLNHLVQRLNRDDILTEGLVKFNAFIFGLLNVNSLDAWFTYLRTRDGLLHKYYNNRGLLLLSNSAGAPVRTLMDRLIQIIRPLSEITFTLDLMYQAKLLHCSLQNLNCLLEAKNNDLLSPAKHLMLLKLVQSIQNSISQPSEGRKTRQTSEELEKLVNDPQVPKLLEQTPPARSQTTNRPRPRSGCDILKSDNTSDVASCLKKRWSGIQLNSKLLQAFERLGEETESEYTDSLDNIKGNRGCQASPAKTCSNGFINSNETIDEISHTWNDTDSSESKTKEKRRNILSNLNKKNCNRLDTSKTDSEDKEKSEISGSKIPNGGHKFKRLQQKWEKLSAKSSSDCSSGPSTPQTGISPSHRSKLPALKHITPDKSSCDTNYILPSPTSRISRIPRPVCSPGQTTPTNEKQSYIPKKSISPSASSNSNLQEKISAKSSNVNAKCTKTESISKTSVPSRISRVDEVPSTNVDLTRGRAVRPSSLPYRGPSTVATKKNVPVRASSTSLNRRVENKKGQSTPKVVRTLSHRLPSDSGHLSFNEGEKLKVVLEVDETWLLCCRGTQKGLVPKSAVIPVPEHLRY